jgi:hypothetical protein
MLWRDERIGLAGRKEPDQGAELVPLRYPRTERAPMFFDWRAIAAAAQFHHCRSDRTHYDAHIRWADAEGTPEGRHKTGTDQTNLRRRRQQSAARRLELLYDVWRAAGFQDWSTKTAFYAARMRWPDEAALKVKERAERAAWREIRLRHKPE